MSIRQSRWDAILIGSGFGGAMAAWRLVQAGMRVLMLERGGWADRGEPARDDVRGFFQATSGYTMETAYRVRHRERWTDEGICACVGGPSVFYGGASLRFREVDFEGTANSESGAAWPVDYRAMEPYYSAAEQRLGVAGQGGEDPTEPFRSSEYPQPPAPLSRASARIAAAAESLGLHPFRLPLARNHAPDQGPVCTQCTTCDAYACWNGSKNDVATRVITPLLAAGMTLLTGRVVTRLLREGDAVTGVECVDRATGARETHLADRTVLAAGALASPHLLLASGLERHNPAGAAIGRHLMRHCNAFVYGIFRTPPDPDGVHHKQIAINDFYYGDPNGRGPAGRLGNIQQIMAPQIGAVVGRAPLVNGRSRWLSDRFASAVRRFARRMTGLQVIAEDEPQWENRVSLGRGYDRFGLPQVEVHHEYSPRDLQARRALVERAREILKASGAAVTITYPVTTFSHAVGTVRMGDDPWTSPLDAACRYRGLRNLWVSDGSSMPTSAGVNPSLTIAANALRVGEAIVRDAGGVPSSPLSLLPL